MEILRLLLQILSDWLKLRVYRERWTLQNDVAKYVDEIEDEIKRARNAGDDELADRLLQRLSAATANPIPRTGWDSSTLSGSNVPSSTGGTMAQSKPLSGS